ncbi:MAG: ABC transporter substrate-binding protein, partial [Deltaproteobacteria bacterium]|nr:ABC transporter substrate-binding protein [Deltaproteobacteria bacterium]
MDVILKGWWKVVLIAVLLVGMGAILPLNAQADPAGPVVDEWRIPTILFLSGAYAHIGEMMKFSQEEGVKDINSTGGIRGKPLVIDWHDSATDAMKAVAEMSKVVEDALVIIGPNYAPAAALPLATRNKVFCLPYTAGTQIVI